MSKPKATLTLRESEVTIKFTSEGIELSSTKGGDPVRITIGDVVTMLTSVTHFLAYGSLPSFMKTKGERVGVLLNAAAQIAKVTHARAVVLHGAAYSALNDATPINPDELPLFFAGLLGAMKAAGVSATDMVASLALELHHQAWESLGWSNAELLRYLDTAAREVSHHDEHPGCAAHTTLFDAISKSPQLLAPSILKKDAKEEEKREQYVKEYLPTLRMTSDGDAGRFIDAVELISTALSNFGGPWATHTNSKMQDVLDVLMVEGAREERQLALRLYRHFKGNPVLDLKVGDFFVFLKRVSEEYVKEFNAAGHVQA